MSEVLDLPDSECSRALGLLCRAADDELTAEQSAWLAGHMETCRDCNAASARLNKIDRQLMGWGERLSRQNPPQPEARTRLGAKLGRSDFRERATRWIPAAAAAIAAALLLTIMLPEKKLPVGFTREQPRFVAIPYVPSLDPQENATIVRMDIRVATLRAVGYRVTADPETLVPADVLVGEDGRAHAVRVLSGIELN
jgi:hypothetical protein